MSLTQPKTEVMHEPVSNLKEGFAQVPSRHSVFRKIDHVELGTDFVINCREALVRLASGVGG